MSYLDTDGFLFQSADVLFPGKLVTDGLLHVFAPDTGGGGDIYATRTLNVATSFSALESLVDQVANQSSVTLATVESQFSYANNSININSASSESIVDALINTALGFYSSSEAIADSKTLSIASSWSALEAIFESLVNFITVQAQESSYIFEDVAGAVNLFSSFAFNSEESIADRSDLNVVLTPQVFEALYEEVGLPISFTFSESHQYADANAETVDLSFVVTPQHLTTQSQTVDLSWYLTFSLIRVRDGDTPQWMWKGGITGWVIPRHRTRQAGSAASTRLGQVDDDSVGRLSNGKQGKAL